MLKVKFFAAFREITGLAELELPLTENVTVAAVLQTLQTQYPALEAGLKSALLMVNRRYANRQTVIQDGDELGVLPPVGGGA